MNDPVLMNRLAQEIHAERLAEAERARRRHWLHHQRMGRTPFGHRVGIYAGNLLIAVGQRLKARADRALVQTT